MWWDLSEITLLDSILFSVVALVVLYTVGYGIVKLISGLSRRSDPFFGFDFCERTNYRLFFGFVFIFLFLFVFSASNFSLVFSTIFIVAASIAGIVFFARSFKFKLPRIKLQEYWYVFVVFAVLFVTLFLASSLIVGSYGPAIDDGADHTLMVRIVLDNPNTLWTHSTAPFANIPLNYPVATHVLSAFLLTVLNVPIQKIVLLVNAILPALVALSFYSTIKGLFGSKILAVIGLVISAFFTVGLFFGPLSWSGGPFLLSIYISATGMALMYIFMVKRKVTFLNSFLLGLIFFVAIRTYPVSLLILTFWFILMVVLWSIFRLKDKSVSFSKWSFAKVFAFLTPLLLSVPYLFFIFTNNIYLFGSSSPDGVSSTAAAVVKARMGFNWFIDMPALSHFFSEMGSLFILVPLALIPVVVISILWVSKRHAVGMFARTFVVMTLLVYALLLSLMGYLALTLYLPINILTSFLNPERVWAHLVIPAIILTSVVLFSCGYLFYVPLKRLFVGGKTKLSRVRNKAVVSIVLVVVILGAGFLAIPVVSTQKVVFDETRDRLGIVQVIKLDDLQLMSWIKENIPTNGNILVSWGDSGQYLAAITQHQTFSLYSRTTNYTSLMSILTANASDPKAIPLLEKYDVSYVYVGSTGVYPLEGGNRRQFNATQLLSTPYFALTKQVGNAWLFEFNSSAISNINNDISK
jgi:hypothetical protein